MAGNHRPGCVQLVPKQQRLNGTAGAGDVIVSRPLNSLLYGHGLMEEYCFDAVDGRWARLVQACPARPGGGCPVARAAGAGAGAQQRASPSERHASVRTAAPCKLCNSGTHSGPASTLRKGGAEEGVAACIPCRQRRACCWLLMRRVLVGPALGGMCTVTYESARDKPAPVPARACTRARLNTRRGPFPAPGTLEQQQRK